MVGRWLVVLPLLVDLNRVISQPITNEDSDRRLRQLDLRECCPCPGTEEPGLAARAYGDGSTPQGCSCEPRADDTAASASMLFPALRAMQPFVKQSDQKNDPKPLLQPEVGLASSVLETLRQATDEEYKDALARDAARTAVKLIESTLDPLDDTFTETPKNIVRIFLNPKGDDMDDNLPEPSHIQETRCIHSPLESIHSGKLRISRPPLESIRKNAEYRVTRPTPIIEVIDLPPKPVKKIKNKGLLHRNLHAMDSSIGASNVQERIVSHHLDGLESLNLKSNPALFSLFSHNNIEKSEDNFKKNLEINKNVEDVDLDQKPKPKIHSKLRQLIDNLESNSNKAKPKLSAIDLKKYFYTTRTPPLKFQPIEPLFNNRPPLLKDLLKLKDVELIPRKELTSNFAARKLANRNLKLQSEKSSVDTDNCDENKINIVPSVNENIKTSELLDPEVSPSNSNPIFESQSNEVNTDVEQNFIPLECIASSENSHANSNQPSDFETFSNSDYSGGIDMLADPDSKQLLDDCDASEENFDVQKVSNSKNEKQGFPNEQVPKFKGSQDTFTAESNNNVFPIELVEDLDLPIEFDNSSFIAKSDLENNNNVNQPLNEDEITKRLNDNFENISNNDLLIIDQSNENPMTVDNLREKNDGCISHQSFSQNFNPLTEDQSSLQTHQELNFVEQIFPEDDIKLSVNNARDEFSDNHENPSQISFQDLQGMSDSILALSETEEEENVNMGSNFNGINGGCDTSNTLFEPNMEENIKDSSQGKANINSKSQLNELAPLNPEESFCNLSLDNETQNTEPDISSIRSDIENREMSAQATDIDPMTIPKKSFTFDDSIKPLFRNTAEDVEQKRVFTKPITDLSNILQVSKHSEIINNLRTKLEGLFSTTEKAMLTEVLNSPDDNTNESSNISPVTANFKNNGELQRTQQILLPQIPQLKLNSNTNKLAVPKYVDRSLTNNPNNFLNIPLPNFSPFEDKLDPSLNFNDLSDRLRSHTENAIQNVKDTLEYTLKDSPSFRFTHPTGESLDGKDVIESLSNRRDEMKEKLEAIHLDLNDRFSTFQQSILDHFNLNRNFDYQENNSNGRLKSSYIPKRKESLLPKASKVPNVKDESNFLATRRNIPKNILKTEITLDSPSNFRASNTDILRNSERKPSLQNPKPTKIPSFIPRSKVLKTNMDTIPKINSGTLSKAKPSKIPNLFNKDITESETKFSEEPLSSPKYGSLLKTKVSLKSPKTNKVSLSDYELSQESPVNKFTKTLLEATQNQKSRNEFPKIHRGFTSSTLDNNGNFSTKKESILSRMKDGRFKVGSGNNNEMILSPTTQIDRRNPVQNEDGFRLVEPMKENVPYKCKLICYKDS